MPPLLDAPALLENISKLETSSLILFAGCLAFAFYFAVEGFVSDFAESEYEVARGKVTDSRFKFGEDSPGFIVEFRAESGQMHMIEEVRHPLRALKVGESLMVRYPRSRPDRAKPHYSPLTSTTLRLFKIGAALAIAYSVAARGG
ncbi:MAG: hypothetical protein EDM03_13745 [Porphyrobacter sp. IPPAS B-1204]|nr:MAG: hypothetical protein EDM03_13745 [Porphyrobacter sp. IPPAS B-1204]